MIRVLLADDQPAIRSALCAAFFVYDDIELVGEATNGAKAVKLCAEVLPDVVVMDILMPDMNGATATRLIRQQYPSIQVLALTSFAEDYVVQGVLNAGAIGCLLKNISAEELVDAIRGAYDSRPTLSPEILNLLNASASFTPQTRHENRQLVVDLATS